MYILIMILGTEQCWVLAVTTIMATGHWPACNKGTGCWVCVLTMIQYDTVYDTVLDTEQPQVFIWVTASLVPRVVLYSQ